MVGSLDMTKRADRSLMLSIIDSPDRRFGALDKTMRDDFTRALKVAMRWALEKQDHRAVNGCVMTMAALEKMNQADEHLAFKAAVPEQHEHTHRLFNITVVMPDRGTA